MFSVKCARSFDFKVNCSFDFKVNCTPKRSGCGRFALYVFAVVKDANESAFHAHQYNMYAAPAAAAADERHHTLVATAPPRIS